MLDGMIEAIIIERLFEMDFWWGLSCVMFQGNYSAFCTVNHAVIYTYTLLLTTLDLGSLNTFSPWHLQ